jgi:integrase
MDAGARAGLAYRRPYSLRHTYATWQLAAGQPLPYVAAQLGHASPMMLLTVYGRWLPKTRREAPARFEAALAAGRPVDLPAAVVDGPTRTDANKPAKSEDLDN